jgi:hypothetical protein
VSAAGLTLVWADGAGRAPAAMLSHAAPLATAAADGTEPALLGWIAPARVDAGVPEPLQQAIAQALCDIGWVVFASGRVMAIAPGAWQADAQGAWATSSIAVGRPKRRPAWRATRDAADAARLFDQTFFDWQQQAQRVAVFAGDALPAPSDAFASALLADEPGVSAVLPHLRLRLFPGADGDFALAVFADAAARADFAGALRRACESGGIGWRELEVAALPSLKWMTSDESQPRSPQRETGE